MKSKQSQRCEYNENIMKKIGLLFLLSFFFFLPQKVIAEDCFGAANPIYGYGNCGCMENQGRCFWADETLTGDFTVNNGDQDCRQDLGKKQICYLKAPTPTHDASLGSPTPTPIPIQQTQPGTSLDQTVPAPGAPSWTPTPFLDSFQDALDQSTAGAIGGYCATGGVVFTGNATPDFSGEISEGPDVPNILKGLIASISEKIKSFTGPAMTGKKMVEDAVQPTKFCPISGLNYFYEANSTDGVLINPAEIVNTQKTFSNNGESEILDAIGLSKYDSQLQIAIAGMSSQQKVILAIDMLRSTKDMKIDEKGETLEKIRKVLGTISCRCEDPTSEAVTGQKGQSSVAGASTLMGEVLGSATPYNGLPGQCFVGAKLSPDARMACTAWEYCGPLKDNNNDNNKEYEKCFDCLYKDKGSWTAVGCVYSDFSKTITEVIFPVAISFAGLIALGCIIYASFIMQTSSGDPEKIKKAQELITSCITGLIVIIFSIVFLKIIGVDILRIPGFG